MTRVLIPGIVLDAWREAMPDGIPDVVRAMLLTAPTKGKGNNRRAAIEVPDEHRQVLADVALKYFTEQGEKHNYLLAQAAFAVHAQVNRR